jgi:probable F420-dependent oxidoreductase
MQFVVSLAFSPLAHLGPMAQATAAAGFAAVSVSDHVVHPRTIDTPYPYTADGQPRWEPFTVWPDPFVAIGAMAAVTTRVRFLTSVLVLPMRNPFLVAKAVATAAVLSENRVTLGIGAGWMKDEFELLGQDFHARGKRMDEMIEVLRKLWAGGWVEHHGRFYDFAPLEMSPVPTAPVPIYCGGVSEAALRRAAQRCDGWIADLHGTDELRALIAKVRAYRADSPRAGQPLAVVAAVLDAFDLDGYRRLADLGVTHLITMPWIFTGGTLDSLQQKCDGIRRFGDDVIAKMP